MIKKITSLLLISTVAFTGLVGCNDKKEEASKGRYIEEECKVPENINYVTSFKSLDDGSLALIGASYEEENIDYNYFKSDDNGENWYEEELPEPSIGEGKVGQAAEYVIKDDGTIIGRYDIKTEEQQKKIDELEKQYEENPYLVIDEFENEDLYKSEIQFVEISTNGEVRVIELDDNNIESVGEMIVSDNNLLFTEYSFDGSETLWQVDLETGKVKKKFKDEQYYNSLCVIDDYLLINNYENVKKYNLKTGKSDGEEKGLIKKGEYINNLIAGEKNVVYYDNDKGLYKYKLGDKEGELIIDASLSTFGDTTYQFSGLVEGEEDVLFALFADHENNNVKLCKYTYDSEISSKPENQITLYSLNESSLLKQAIVQYQKKNPDIYINYEVGISYSEEESVSETDAIKALNTEVLAGNGPDVIILDGLNSDTYIEKGLLEDISDVINKNKDDYFDNIYKAYSNDEKIYSFPTRFTIPVITGRGLDSKVVDLKSLEEQLTKEGSNSGQLFSIYSPEELIALLYNSCSPIWINEDNTLNEEKLKEFLDSAKNIYGLIDKSTSEEAKKKNEEEMKERSEYWTEVEYINSKYLYNQYLMNDNLNPERSKYEIGTISDEQEINILNAIKDEKYNVQYNIWQGQVGSYFIPTNEVAVSAKSKNKEVAKDFIGYLFDEELQDYSAYEGLPINKKSFEKLFINDKEEDLGGFGFAVGEGDNPEDFINIELKKLSEEDAKKLIETVETLEKPQHVNYEVYEKIKEPIVNYVAGNSSMEDSIKEIKNKLEIYLSE